jgi:hypothetical protein
MNQGMYIDGIASSQAIDTAGEVVSIQGMDISSLVGSVFNWEHNSDTPMQVVGKILYAKKIFEEGDCENDRQKKCWASCQMPFLYVMGQLFDDRNPAAKEVAGMFMYDQNAPELPPTLGFSIEGSKISKEGMIVTRSIARKVTITCAPANKTCLAGAVQDEGQASQDDDISNIFKTEYVVDMVKAEDAEKMLSKAEDEYKKGSVLGQTKSGKDVYSHGPVHASGFDQNEHEEAAQMHFSAAGNQKGNPKMAQHHYDKYKMHSQKISSMKDKAERFKASAPKTISEQPPKYGKLHDPRMSGTGKPPGPIKKAMTADSGLGAPQSKNQGAALCKHGKKPKKLKKSDDVMVPDVGQGHKDDARNKSGSVKIGKKVMRKSSILQRAEEAYKNWTKREEFERFMKNRMPNLTKGEIAAFGQTLALKKSLDAETLLADLVNYEIKKS